ncbi:hypothetical protein VTL71DRAFT_12027 [Oculimacula yallundae]|uniref:Uncharacterized protein n=1 Tax=Oculimacula yallundae TaxID=86028 RepID=A0ABR4CRR8_9HELO
MEFPLSTPVSTLSTEAKSNFKKLLNRMQSNRAGSESSSTTSIASKTTNSSNKGNSINNIFNSNLITQQNPDIAMVSSSPQSTPYKETDIEVDPDTVMDLTPPATPTLTLASSTSSNDITTQGPMSQNIFTTSALGKLNTDADIEMELTPPDTPILDFSGAFNCSALYWALETSIDNTFSLDSTKIDIDNDNRSLWPVNSEAIFDTDMECAPTDSISGVELQFLREKGALRLMAAKINGENDVDMEENKKNEIEIEDVDIDMYNGNDNNTADTADNLGLNEIERGKVRNSRAEYFARKELEGRDEEMSDVADDEILEFDMMIDMDAASGDPVDDLVSVLALL